MNLVLTQPQLQCLAIPIYIFYKTRPLQHFWDTGPKSTAFLISWKTLVNNLIVIIINLVCNSWY